MVRFRKHIIINYQKTITLYVSVYVLFQTNKLRRSHPITLVGQEGKTLRLIYTRGRNPVQPVDQNVLAFLYDLPRFR